MFRDLWTKKTAGTYEEQLGRLRRALADCDAVVLGAGSGLSTSAGLTYSGERFERYFSDFIGKYRIRDMYSGGFYPFRSAEEYWAWWSRHIWVNRYSKAPKPVYDTLLSLVADKDYFVLTTNVDHQFQRAGFDKRRLFYTQGDYGLFQSAEPRLKKTYDNEDAVRAMLLAQGFVIGADGELSVPEGVTLKMEVPTELVPVCPDDGKRMIPNLRADDHFVEDAGWHAASRRYADFLAAQDGRRVLFWEMGVGGNTPVIIKYPFWRMTERNKNATYACVNLGDAEAPEQIADRSICIDADIGGVLDGLRRSAMTQEERLDRLVERFKEDSGEYRDLKVGDGGEEKRRVLRSLMNIRAPRPLDGGTLRLQDEYLQERAREKGVVTLADIPSVAGHPLLSIWQGDITRLAVDAIVNAANAQMLGCFVPMHTCIDNCIHTFAGVQLRAACARQMGLLRERYGRDYEQPTAVPMLTDGYNLPAKKVVHVVGPIVRGRLTEALEQDLADCYANTLDLCAENGLRSVAFCCISTGVFRFPNDRAARIAVRTVTDWLASHEGALERVIFNVFRDEDRRLYERELQRS